MGIKDKVTVTVNYHPKGAWRKNSSTPTHRITFKNISETPIVLKSITERFGNGIGSLYNDEGLQTSSGSIPSAAKILKGSSSLGTFSTGTGRNVSVSKKGSPSEYGYFYPLDDNKYLMKLTLTSRVVIDTNKSLNLTIINGETRGILVSDWDTSGVLDDFEVKYVGSPTSPKKPRVTVSSPQLVNNKFTVTVENSEGTTDLWIKTRNSSGTWGSWENKRSTRSFTMESACSAMQFQARNTVTNNDYETPTAYTDSDVVTVYAKLRPPTSVKLSLSPYISIGESVSTTYVNNPSNPSGCSPSYQWYDGTTKLSITSQSYSPSKDPSNSYYLCKVKMRKGNYIDSDETTSSDRVTDVRFCPREMISNGFTCKFTYNNKDISENDIITLVDTISAEWSSFPIDKHLGNFNWYLLSLVNDTKGTVDYTITGSNNPSESRSRFEAISLQDIITYLSPGDTYYVKLTGCYKSGNTVYDGTSENVTTNIVVSPKFLIGGSPDTPEVLYPVKEINKSVNLTSTVKSNPVTINTRPRLIFKCYCPEETRDFSKITKVVVYDSYQGVDWTSPSNETKSYVLFINWDGTSPSIGESSHSGYQSVMYDSDTKGVIVVLALEGCTNVQDCSQWNCYSCENRKTVDATRRYTIQCSCNFIPSRFFDSSQFVCGYTIYSPGTEGSGYQIRNNTHDYPREFAVLDKIVVSPGSSYTFKLDNTNYWVDRILETDESGLLTRFHYPFYITGEDYSEYTLTTMSSTKYLVMEVRNKNGEDATVEGIIETGLTLSLEKFVPDTSSLLSSNWTSNSSIDYVVEVKPSTSLKPTDSASVATEGLSADRYAFSDHVANLGNHMINYLKSYDLFVNKSNHDISKILSKSYYSSEDDFKDSPISPDSTSLKVQVGYAASCSCQTGAPYSLVKSARYSTFKDIAVVPNTSYTFTLDNTKYRLYRIIEFDENYLFVNRGHHAFYATGKDLSEYTFTSQPGTRYVVFVLYDKESNSTLERVLSTGLQIYRGPVENQVFDLDVTRDFSRNGDALQVWMRAVDTLYNQIGLYGSRILPIKVNGSFVPSDKYVDISKIKGLLQGDEIRARPTDDENYYQGNIFNHVYNGLKYML